MQFNSKFGPQLFIVLPYNICDYSGKLHFYKNKLEQYIAHIAGKPKFSGYEEYAAVCPHLHRTRKIFLHDTCTWPAGYQCRALISIIKSCTLSVSKSNAPSVGFAQEDGGISSEIIQDTSGTKIKLKVNGTLTTLLSHEFSE